MINLWRFFIRYVINDNISFSKITLSHTWPDLTWYNFQLVQPELKRKSTTSKEISYRLLILHIQTNKGVLNLTQWYQILQSSLWTTLTNLPPTPQFSMHLILFSPSLHNSNPNNFGSGKAGLCFKIIQRRWWSSMYHHHHHR